MGIKVALLVGVGKYGKGLQSLQCPINGVYRLKEVLERPDIGGFSTVIPLINPDVGTLRRIIGQVFSGLKKDDLVLFYFTGHGIKDMSGEFYLTTTESELLSNGEINRGTAIESSFLKGEIRRCYAQRKVVILDCCFGAAFADGFLTMDDGSMSLESQLGGEGWVVLTAANARNYALEQEGEPLSVYTRYLVEGLKTGAAALVGQENISVGHLHEYVRNQVQIAAPTMEPEIFNARQGSNIWLSKVSIADPLLRYRREAEKYVRNAEITITGRNILKKLGFQLKLTQEQQARIEAEVLQPHIDLLRNSKEYEECYQAAWRKHGVPLPKSVRAELFELKRILNLREEDIRLSRSYMSKLVYLLDNSFFLRSTSRKEQKEDKERRKNQGKKKNTKNPFKTITLFLAVFLLTLSGVLSFKIFMENWIRENTIYIQGLPTEKLLLAVRDSSGSINIGSTILIDELHVPRKVIAENLQDLVPGTQIGLEGFVTSGEFISHPFNAAENQTLQVKMVDGKNIELTVLSPSNVAIGNIRSIGQSWQVSLAETGEYAIVVRPIKPDVDISNFEMIVSLEQDKQQNPSQPVLEQIFD